MVDVTISLVGANGDTIALSDSGDYVLASGVSGFGIPATKVRIDDSAGNGGMWRHTRRGVRDIDLPIVIFGSNRADVETKLRRLARLLQDFAGATRIVADYDNGDALFLEAHYVGGAETQFGSDAGLTYCRWVIQMQAPQPFWESANSQSFTITGGNTGRGLLPQLTKLKVSSSQALGTVSVTSSADVEVYPVWTIRGPISNLTVTNGEHSFGFNATLNAGESIIIDTEAGTVTGDNGSNRYSLLSAAPKFFTFPTGTTLIEVNGTDASTSTYIRCDYALRYEVIH